MSTVARISIVAYLVALTLGMLAGRWPLQGPLLLTLGGSHGVHMGDVVVLLLSSAAVAALLRRA